MPSEHPRPAVPRTVSRAVTPPASRRGFFHRVGSLPLAGAMSVAAACAMPGRRSDDMAASSTAPLPATVLTFNNPIFHNSKDELIAALAEADPKLQPDIVVFPGQIGQFREKVLTMYAGGDIPDAQWIHPSITSLMASRKLLRPLEDLAKRDRENLKDFYPGLLDQSRWKEVTYALPWYSTGAAWFFNRQLFERMGVTLPDKLEKDGKWTWDTFLSSMRGVTRGLPGSPDRTIGSAAHNMNLDWACAWIWRTGGEVFSKDVKQCLLNQPAAVEAIQQLADLHLKHQVISYGPHASDFPGGFTSGRIGLRYAAKGDTAPAQNALSAVTFPLGMVPTYKGKAGRVNRLAALAFGAAQGAPNGDAGWRWARFMGGPKAAAVLMGHGTTLPVRPAFQQLPEFARSMQPYENKDIWLESQATARALQQPASYQDIADMWIETWRNIVAERGPTKGLLDDLVRQVNSLLAQE